MSRSAVESTAVEARLSKIRVEDRFVRDQIKLLGILNIIWGSISLLFAIGALMFMSAIAAIVSGNATDVDTARAAPFMALIGLMAAIVLACIGLPAIIGGWGLLKFKRWSRIFMIVISALHLPNIPFGTALGVFGLIVLLKDEARALLEGGGRSQYYAPPPSSMTPPPPVAPTQ
jgi:uncharacterized membrane protein (DUF2068 family)